MKKAILILTLIAVTFFAANCGNSPGIGGGSSSSPSQSAGASAGGTGAFYSRIHWPSAPGSRYIPVTTSTITVSIIGDGISSGSPMTASARYGETSIYINNVPVGNKRATISAVDSGGNILTQWVIDFTQASGRVTTADAPLGVVLSDTGFTPSSIAIPVGSVFYFKNIASRTYTLSGGPFSSGSPSTFVINGSLSPTFSAVGSYTISVLEKPSATLSVTVTTDPTPTPTPAGLLSVDALLPSSGIVGDTIKIVGSGFGSTQSTSTVTFNGTTATNILSWSPYSIICTVPSGAATGNVVVTVSGTSSVGVAFTVQGSWTPGIQ